MTHGLENHDEDCPACQHGEHGQCVDPERPCGCANGGHL